MAGAETPLSGELGEDTNTNATQEQLFEDLAEVVRRMPGAGEISTPGTIELSIGSFTPFQAFHWIDTEGTPGATSDNFDRMDPANMLNRSIVFVAAINGGVRPITCRDAQGGTGPLAMKTAAFVLNNNYAYIGFVKYGTTWYEFTRSYGIDTLTERSDMGLGTAATEDEGVLDAGTLESNPASYFLAAAAQAVDSAQLAGVAAANYARLDVGTEQSFAGVIRSEGTVIQVNNAGAGQASVFRNLIQGIIRGQTVFDDAFDEVRIEGFNADGATLESGIKLAPNLLPKYWNLPNTEWRSIIDEEALADYYFGSIRKYLSLAANQSVGALTEKVILNTVLPQAGSAAERWYKIEALMSANLDSGPTAPFNLRVYCGPNNNIGSDTLIYDNQYGFSAVHLHEPYEFMANDANAGAQGRIHARMVVKSSTTDYINLVCYNPGSPTGVTVKARTNPDAYNLDEQTFLDIEQIK